MFSLLLSRKFYFQLELQGDKPSTVQNTLSMLSDSALVTVMSQCMLLLKQPEISNRQKQILKRELSDELVSRLDNFGPSLAPKKEAR